MFANIKMFDNEISDQELKLEVRSLVHLKWEIGEICLVLFPQLGHFTAEPSRTPARESPVSKAKYWVNSRCVCAVSNKNTVTCWGLPGQSLSLSLRAHHLIGWAAWLLCEADHGECQVPAACRGRDGRFALESTLFVWFLQQPDQHGRVLLERPQVNLGNY